MDRDEIIRLLNRLREILDAPTVGGDEIVEQDPAMNAVSRQIKSLDQQKKAQKVKKKSLELRKAQSDLSKT